MEYKPLSELHKDAESCKKIFESIDIDLEFSYAHRSVIYTFLHGFQSPEQQGDRPISVELSIRDDGEVVVRYDDKPLFQYNFFLLVDMIRSLGYSA